MTSVVTSSLTSASRQSHVTVVSSSTAAVTRCVARPASKLPSPAARSRATIDQLTAEIATTNGVSNDHYNDDFEDSSSSVPRSTRVVTLAFPQNVDESRDLMHTSNSVELPPLATGGVSQPPLKSFGNKSDEVSGHRGVDSSRRSDVGERPTGKDGRRHQAGAGWSPVVRIAPAPGGDPAARLGESGRRRRCDRLLGGGGTCRQNAATAARPDENVERAERRGGEVSAVAAAACQAKRAPVSAAASHAPAACEVRAGVGHRQRSFTPQCLST